MEQGAAVPHPGSGATKGRLPPVPLAERITLTVDEFAARMGIGRATAWRRVRDGSVRVVRLGRRTLVPASEARRLAEGGGAGA